MPRLRGTWLSYEWAVSLAILGSLVAMSATAVAAIVFDRMNPLTISVITGMGISLPSLISALKATETADTAAKTSEIVSFTASKIGTYNQLALSCPYEHCPMKGVAAVLGASPKS